MIGRLFRRFSLLVWAVTIVSSSGSIRVAHAGSPTGLFWTAPDDDAPAATVRATFERVLKERGVRLADAPVVDSVPPSLARRLALAVEDYAALHLDEATRALEAIALDAARLGGGDLDRASLGDLFLHLALTQQELGRGDRGWESFVHAARVDPTRALDPARVTPRAAAAFRRAVEELSREPRAQLTVHAPPIARLRIDGEEQPLGAPLSLTPGTYFVQLSCPGYETWRGTLIAKPAATEISPPLHPLRPPSLDAVARVNEQVVFLALYRGEDTHWRVFLRERQERARSIEIDELLAPDIDHQVRELVDVALGRREVPRVVLTAPAATRQTPLVRRWWLWTSVGVAAAALGVGLGVGLTRSSSSSGGSAGGVLEPVR